MKPDEKIEFEWIANRLRDLAPAAISPATASLANAAVQMLTVHVEEVLPMMIPAYHAAQQKTAEAAKGGMTIDGPAAWARLHKRAFSAPTPINKNTERGWLFSFGSGLPCGDCRTFFAKYMQTVPPDFADYFAWTVGMHNAVNAKLTAVNPQQPKPQITLEQAIALWSLKAGTTSAGSASTSSKL